MVLASKRCFSFRRTFALLELIMQRWLKNANVERGVAQRDRRGVRGDEFCDDRIVVTGSSD
jgi:hypothetical protein